MYLQLEVAWAKESLVTWKEGVKVGEEKDKTSPSLSSKLLRAEMSLRKHGRRRNRLASTIVNPRSSNDTYGDGGPSSPATRREFKDRDIVAYDDIL